MKVFDLVYVLTRGGPADGTITLNYLSYREAFNFGHLGSGAAVANVLFLILLLAAFGYIRIVPSGTPSQGVDGVPTGS